MRPPSARGPPGPTAYSASQHFSYRTGRGILRGVPASGRRIDERGGSARRYEGGRPLPPPDVEADPEPGMIAKTRGPLSVKNHAFAVCAQVTLGSTIHFEP